MKQHPLPKRLGALLVCFVLLVGLLPMSALAEDSGEPATPSDAIDSAVTDVQALIDALPTAEELERMSQDEQAAIYEQVQAAYDAYNALSDEQKAQITGAEVFDELFAVFNSMTNTLVTVGGFNVEGDSSGYSYSSGILTINNDANLTISTNGQTADRIVVASGATATITLNNVSIATTNNNTPIDVPNNSTLTLNLVNGSQNTISATSSSVTDCGSPGIHVPSGAQLMIQGEGSLSVIGASVSNGSWAGVGIGGRAVGGVQTGEACGTVIILGGNVTVSGGSGGNKTPVGIGGGGSWYGGAGGTVIILNGNVAVTGGIGRGPGASGSQSGANGQGIRPSSSGSNTYDVYGNLILPDGVTLPGNITIYIPEGASLSLPEGASWPENVTITGGGSISPKLTATITISANLDKTHDGSAVSLDSSGYTYTGDTTTPTITITWHEDNSGTIGNQLTDNAAPSAPGTYWVKVSAAETNRYAAAEATKQFTISQPLDAPTNLKWDSDTPGQATWGTVTNASGYSVQLYKGGSTQGSPVTTSGTSYDFQITEAGSYTFTVTATGSGVYSDSSPSSQSTALHTVAFDTNGGTGTISMQLVPNGGTVTEPTAPTRTGHDFVGWYKDSGLNTAWDFENDTVTTTTTLYAKWTALQYEVTLNTNGGTINSGNVTEYTYGVGATLPTAENMTYTGHDFEGWYENSDFSGSAVTAISTTDTGAKTYYAKWEASTYDVTLEANGGTINSGNVTEYTYGQGATLPTADDMTYIGHDFGGWYDNQELTGSPITAISTTDTGEKTYYAKWTLIDYAITVTVAGGTGNSASASVNSTTVTSANMGDTVTLTATPTTGYHFVEWQVTSGGVTISEQNTFTMPAEAVAITAVFAEHSYTNWTANGNDTHTGTCSCGQTSTQACNYENGVCTVCGYVDVTTTDPASSSIKEGETATFTITATGNGISYQWQISTDGSAWADIDRANSSSYTTQAATMDMNGDQYRCVVSNTTGDSATSSAATLTVNKTPSTIDPAFIGYFVEHYQKDPASGKYELYEREYFVDEINAEVTATPKNYTGYAYNSAAAGTVTSGTLTKIEDEADIVTLKLYYDPESYSVTLNTNGGTITSGDVTEYTYGIGAALPTAEDMTYNGYVFKGWYENSDFSGEAVTAISATDTGDKTYYAQWTRLYTVTVTAGNGGTVSGGGLFEDGSTVFVTASANSGYEFVRWTENGVEVSTSESYSFELTADRDLTAVFRVRSTGGGGTTTPTYTSRTLSSNGVTLSGSGIHRNAHLTATTGGLHEAGTCKSCDQIRAWQDAGRVLSICDVSLSQGFRGTVTITFPVSSDYNGKTLTVVHCLKNELETYQAAVTNGTIRVTVDSLSPFAILGTKENPDAGLRNPFADISEGNWFYNAVMYVYRNGLMAGTSGTTFDPDGITTRGQIVTILWRMAGSPQVDYLMDYFDVDSTAYYGEAIRWATAEGIASGYGNGLFGPDDPITREQFAVILHRYARHMGYDMSIGEDTNLLSYTDAFTVSDFAVSALQWACGAGIIHGTGDGSTLTPQGEATRAQTAIIVMRFCQRYIDNVE